MCFVNNLNEDMATNRTGPFPSFLVFYLAHVERSISKHQAAVWGQPPAELAGCSSPQGQSREMKFSSYLGVGGGRARDGERRGGV